MQVVRHQASAQRFRSYSGPRPPGFSQAAALRRVTATDDYSLGLWDVGMVHEDSSVEWHSVWIIADETFVQDLDRLIIGGAGLSPVGTRATHSPRPGWARSFTMLNAETGRPVLTVVL